jgi:hypothetical protein
MFNSVLVAGAGSTHAKAAVEYGEKLAAKLCARATVPRVAALRPDNRIAADRATP